MNTTAADSTTTTDTVLVGFYTGDDLAEAEYVLRTTWRPWPAGSTPLTVALSLQRLRAQGVVPKRNLR